MVVDLDEQAGVFEVREHALARLVAVEPRVRAALFGDGGVGIEDVDLGAVVALRDLEVIGVMSRRDLDRAGAERGVDVLVGDHGDVPPEQRQHDGGANNRSVALVVGMHGDARVSEHRLGPSRRHHERVNVADRLVPLGVAILTGWLAGRTAARGG